MSSQCSVRVLDIKTIKETRKTRGGAYIRGGLITGFFCCCLQVDGPISGGAYKRGGLTSDSLRYFNDI